MGFQDKIQARIKAAQAQMECKHLAMILFGPPSGGKSQAMGTMGVKTLYLYFSGESHGPGSAHAGGTDILPYCVDLDADGNKLEPDVAYAELVELLQDQKFMTDNLIKAVAVDSGGELEFMIMQTTHWKVEAQKRYKGVESYCFPITLEMFRPVMDALRNLQLKLGMHYVVSCILNVSEFADNGTIASAEPKMFGYGTVSGFLQQFPDRMIVSQVEKDGVLKPRIQLGSMVTKTTKDQKTKEVAKIQHFRPQLQGVDLTVGPNFLPPDLSKLIKYKAAGMLLKAEKPKEA